MKASEPMTRVLVHVDAASCDRKRYLGLVLEVLFDAHDVALADDLADGDVVCLVAAEHLLTNTHTQTVAWSKHGIVISGTQSKHERLLHERLLHERLLHERLLHERLLHERLLHERLLHDGGARMRRRRWRRQ